ncbi:hypothetical protein SEPCBS57363_006624 [Sporothrix epigloea]|uniref:GRIP domain-containing protein n=1 Tax=Sporothrix epigloea TaxID=1892477 RepID=A0ABP0E8B4_9PEZI
MPFEVHSQPLLSPQTDNAALTGNAKKKSRKKLAAAKAAAAQGIDATAKRATVPAASTDTVIHDSAQYEVSEAAEILPNTPSVVAEEKAEQNNRIGSENASIATLSSLEERTTLLDTESPVSSEKVLTNGNSNARKDSNAHIFTPPILTEIDTASVSGSDKDSSAATTVETSSRICNGANDNKTAMSTAPSTPTTSALKPTNNPRSMRHYGFDDEELRFELERLQKQVEGLNKEQESHMEEIEQLRSELLESEAGREEAETKYDNLLGRVGKIKETLDSRLKRDQEELEEARNHIEDLERQNSELRESSKDAETAATAAATAAASHIARLQKELDDAEQDYEHEQRGLRDQARLAHQTLLREKEDLVRQIKQLRTELESTSNAMSEWEVIALEERSVRNSMAERASDLEEQIDILREQHQRVLAENVTQSDTINSLQRALNDVQEARKHELREVVQESEAKLEGSEARAKIAEQAAGAAKAEAERLAKELERKAPFEAEVKEKALLMSKLRHELLVSNDYLAKALRYIKHVNPEDSVNKGVITNNLVAFLVLDRSDPKKFEILQILASILEWKDDVKEKVGLTRPGASASTLRLPASPFGRTPSTPALHAAIFSESVPTGANQPSLSELWTNFLKKSVDSDALDDKPLPLDKAASSTLTTINVSAAPSVQTSVAPSTPSSRPSSVASHSGTLPL